MWPEKPSKSTVRTISQANLNRPFWWNFEEFPGFWTKISLDSNRSGSYKVVPLFFGYVGQQNSLVAMLSGDKPTNIHGGFLKWWIPKPMDFHIFLYSNNFWMIWGYPASYKNPSFQLQCPGDHTLQGFPLAALPSQDGITKSCHGGPSWTRWWCLYQIWVLHGCVWKWITSYECTNHTSTC